MSKTICPNCKKVFVGFKPDDFCPLCGSLLISDSEFREAKPSDNDGNPSTSDLKSETGEDTNPTTSEEKGTAAKKDSTAGSTTKHSKKILVGVLVAALVCIAMAFALVAYIPVNNANRLYAEYESLFTSFDETTLDFGQVQSAYSDLRSQGAIEKLSKENQEIIRDVMDVIYSEQVDYGNYLQFIEKYDAVKHEPLDSLGDESNREKLFSELDSLLKEIPEKGRFYPACENLYEDLKSMVPAAEKEYEEKLEAERKAAEEREKVEALKAEEKAKKEAEEAARKADEKAKEDARKAEEKAKEDARKAEEKAKKDAVEEAHKAKTIIDEPGKQMFLVTMSSNTFRIEGDYSGSGNYIVKLLDSNQNLVALLANEIGSYKLDKKVSVTKGAQYYILIEGNNGSWSTTWEGTYGF